MREFLKIVEENSNNPYLLGMLVAALQRESDALLAEAMGSPTISNAIRDNA